MKLDRQLLALGPCVIGATGGSGTRAVARIASRGDLFIGTKLNNSEDALEFGAYSDRWVNEYMRWRGTLVWPPLSIVMRRSLHRVLAKHLAQLGGAPRPWGWKEPRSIYLLPFYASELPHLRFLHVVRDGRDMAFSSNQRQLKKHGEALLEPETRDWDEPLRSVALWTRVNLAAADYGEGVLGEHYMRVRFEDLCADPVATVIRVLRFLDLHGDPEKIAQDEVCPPKTIGRWRSASAGTVDRLHEIASIALQRFGYLSVME